MATPASSSKGNAGVPVVTAAWLSEHRTTIPHSVHGRLSALDGREGEQVQAVEALKHDLKSGHTTTTTTITALPIVFCARPTAPVEGANQPPCGRMAGALDAGELSFAIILPLLT